MGPPHLQPQRAFLATGSTLLPFASPVNEAHTLHLPPHSPRLGMSPVPPLPQTAVRQMGKRAQSSTPFPPAKPTPPQPGMTSCPREDWSGSRPGSGLSLLGTEAGGGTGTDETEAQWAAPARALRPLPARPASWSHICQLWPLWPLHDVYSAGRLCRCGQAWTDRAHRGPLNGSLWPLSWGPPGRPPQPHSPPSCPSLRHPIGRQCRCPPLCPCPPGPPSVLR